MKTISNKSYLSRLGLDVRRNAGIYIMAFFVILYYIIFHYIPMAGLSIAFTDYDIGDSLFGARWNGFAHFKSFFQGPYFKRTFRNTVVISLYSILLNFPVPIIFALMLNEVRVKWFKKTIQTVSYLPHFISLVVICGLLKEFLSMNGLLTDLFVFFGMDRTNLLTQPDYFRRIIVLSDLWQHMGFNSIIYLAALSGVSQELYEAAEIDGAGRFQKLLSVTIPGIAPTIIIMLILRIGQFMNVGYERILLLYSSSTYETGDIISTFVYRKGIIEQGYAFSTAVSLFNSVINVALVSFANWMSRRYSDTSLW